MKPLQRRLFWEFCNAIQNWPDSLSMSGTHMSALGHQGVGPCGMQKMDNQTDKALEGADKMIMQETTTG